MPYRHIERLCCRLIFLAWTGSAPSRYPSVFGAEAWRMWRLVPDLDGWENYLKGEFLESGTKSSHWLTVLKKDFENTSNLRLTCGDAIIHYTWSNHSGRRGCSKKRRMLIRKRKKQRVRVRESE